MRLDPRITDRFFGLFFRAHAFFVVSLLFAILFVITVKGVPQISLAFLSKAPLNMGREGGILPFIVGTVLLVFFSLLFAVPLGVGTAVFLTEYRKEGRLTRLIRFGVESLAGIPSILYGLFGFIFFVIRLKMGLSLLAGVLTVMIMVLPTIIRTSEEAIRAVPRQLRLVSYSLGATKWETIKGVVLPKASPGILTGIMLSVGRAVGETAALVFTMGSSLRLPTSPTDSGRTLAVHFYILAREGISMEKAYATALVLVFAILLVNLMAYYLMQRAIERSS